MKVSNSRQRGRRAGMVIALIAASAGLTACKDLNVVALPQPGSDPAQASASGEPSTGPSGAPSTAPSASRSAGKPSASPQPTGTSTSRPAASTGYPAEFNTGFPKGLPGDTRAPVRLTAYTGPKTITVNGTVINGKDIVGPLLINAKNVVIRNSRIRVSNAQAVTSTAHDANLLIEDTEIDGQGKDASAGGIALIGRTGFTLSRVNAHGSGDILRMDGRGTVQDSWLHDPRGLLGSQHNDVIQSTNATYVRILHNRLENQHNQTSCILLKADLGGISDVVVDGNLLNGGGYSFYWYDANYRISNGRVTNNRFMRSPTGGYWPKGGYYGTHALRAAQLPAWSGNVWQDNGQPIGR